MKRRNHLFVIIALSVSLLAGCSEQSSTSSTPAKPAEYLDITSDEIVAQGKADFESLVLDKDDFTNEAYYYLTERERNKAAEGVYQFDFFLWKSSKSTEFVPSFSISYIGSEWKFMENAIFKVNDDALEFNPGIEPYRNSLTTTVLEVLMFKMSDKQSNFLGKSKTQLDLDIRINTKIYDEVKLNDLEYRGMRKILSAYRYYIGTK